MTDYALLPCPKFGGISARGAEVTRDNESLPIIVVSDGSTHCAYLNSCPHTGIRLEWREHDFLDADGQYLQCTTHGALFEPATGLCLSGPCIGKSLVPIKIHVSDEVVYARDIEEIPRPARR